MTIRTASFVAAALASALTIGFPAYAQGDDIKMEVSYADLDLSTAQGRAALETRVNRAATSICRSIHNDRTINAARKASACRDQIAQRSLAKMPNSSAFAAAARK